MSDAKAAAAQLFDDIGYTVDNDRQIDYAISIRKKLIDKKMFDEEGNFVGIDDPKELSAYGKLLADMERSAFQRQRLKQDESANENMANLALILAGNKDVIVKNNDLAEVLDESAIANLDESKIPEFEYNEGETDINPEPLNWTSFSKEMEKKIIEEKGK